MRDCHRNGRDAAADNFSFMVLTAAMTDKPLLEGRLTDILRAESRLNRRVDNLPDDFVFATRSWRRDAIDRDAMIFDGADYAKEGLPTMSAWSPPGCLKSTGSAYRYADYANWWLRSLQYLRDNSTLPAEKSIPDFISIQNECGFNCSENMNHYKIGQVSKNKFDSGRARAFDEPVATVHGTCRVGYRRSKTAIATIMSHLIYRSDLHRSRVSGGFC